MAGSLPSSYRCYRCGRFTAVPSHRQDSSVFCSDCNGGLVEEIDNPTRLPDSTLSDSHRTRFPAADMYNSDDSPTFRRNNRYSSDPFIVLSGRDHTGYEMFYADGSGSGLRPVPVSMADFLLGSGFERLLDQLTQIEANGLGRVDRNPRASKAAIEALPVIEIEESHVSNDSYCAVCKDPFELRTEAREMPCDHLYHSDCILPWLNLHNSCPVCRHELPRENQDLGYSREVGLTIWRLPGGGFTVGSGGREREVPVAFTEMDGGVDISSGGPGSSWGSVGNGRRGGGGLRRVLGGWFSCFGGRGRRRRRGLSSSLSSSSSSDDGVNGGSRFIPAIFSSSSRRRRAWPFDVNDRPQMW